MNEEGPLAGPWFDSESARPPVPVQSFSPPKMPNSANRLWNTL